MEIKVYTVPFKNFRRPQLLSTHACSQCLRYDDLKKRIPLEGHCATESTNKFSIDNTELIVCQETFGARNVLEMEDIFKREEDYRLIETLVCDSVATVVNKYSEQRYVALVLQKSIMIDNIPLQENINCILYAENIEERDELRTRYKQTSKVHVSLKEEIGDKLCNIMESFVFKAYGLKEKCENLYRYLNNQSGQEQSQSNNAGDEILQVDVKHTIESDKKMKSTETSIEERNQHESVNVCDDHSLSAHISNGETLFPAEGCCTTENTTFTANPSLTESHSQECVWLPKTDNVMRKRPRSDENGYINDNVMRKRPRSAKNGYMNQENTEVPRRPEIAADEPILEIYSRLKKKNNITERANTNGNMQAEKLHRFNKEQTDLNQKAERLRIEMMGLFNRSRVPQDERPQCKDPFDDTPSDALLIDLRKLELSQCIQGCTFQNRSFLVFLDDECDRDTLKSAIEDVLKNHNYVCPVTFATRKVTPFSSCNVGSNITAVFDGFSQSGTLGGFGTALSVEGNKTIGLTSRHVVTDRDGNPASAIKVSENNTNAKVLVDRSFRDRRENVLDIAAVSFECCSIPLNTKYKTSEENPAKGRITDYTREQMKGLPVHICGSITHTGYGTITNSKIDALQDKDMESFIIVEDREDHQVEKKPFCTEGDSGAIVCADDQDNPDEVHLISMVMGRNLANPGTYHTLDLKDGIQQVEKEIQPKIDLL